MTSRRNIFEVSLALSLASAVLTVGIPALAQDEPTTAEDPAAPLEGGDAPAEETPPEGATGAELTEEPSEPEPVEEPAAPLETTEPEPEPAVPTTPEPDETDKAPAADPAAERNKTVSFVGLELLPGSAFPNDPVRGITNGSLWRTSQGLQWPYLPKIDDKPSLRIGVSGYIWNDLSNARIDAHKSLEEVNVNDQNRWTTQTRGLIRFTPTYNADNGWFAQGNAELVLSGDMIADPSTGVLATTDDLWVRAGKWNVFDVTVGRFQGWEVANHYGMGLDLNTLERSGAWIVSSSTKPTDGYGLTYFWDRQNYLHGAYAVHVYPTKYLRGELMGHVGVGNSANASSPFQTDIRPVGIFDIGWLKLKAGYEWGRSTPQDSEQKVSETKNGYGFAAQFVFDPYVEFGGSFGRGFQDVVDKDEEPDLAASNTVQTVGGFMNVSPGHKPLVLGLGAFLFSWEDFRIDAAPGPHQGKVDTNDQWLLFAAAQYTFWERLNVKFVFSHASNKVDHFRNGSFVNNAMSGRLRVELLF